MPKENIVDRVEEGHMKESMNFGISCISIESVVGDHCGNTSQYGELIGLISLIL